MFELNGFQYQDLFLPALFIFVIFMIFAFLFIYMEGRNIKPSSSSLTFGSELKLEMKDHSRRVVKVLKIRENGAMVQELFHGTYWLDFDDILFVYQGEELMTVSWLKECGRKQEKRIGRS